LFQKKIKKDLKKSNLSKIVVIKSNDKSNIT